jgi:hypothetical protein
VSANVDLIDATAWYYDEEFYAAVQAVYDKAVGTDATAEDIYCGFVGATTRLLMAIKRPDILTPVMIDAVAKMMHDLARQAVPEEYPQ